MIATLWDLLELTLRWLHVITGVAWIGASFYFIWLDNSLQDPPEWKAQQGVKGDLWAFHGGGIYEVAKYRSAPAQMPGHLHWFYWEAYSTWITGMALLMVLYYFQADTYLVAADGLVRQPWAAVATSLAYILSGVVVYELLLRSGISGRIPLLLGVALLLALVYSYLAHMLFSARAAYLHVGILIATIMVANVFIGIIPPQRAMVRALEAGREPDAAAMGRAKLRSTHNNYLTLPVLFCMVSNHYPVLYGHRFAWLLLVYIIFVAAAARQYFNLRHKGIHRPLILVTCAALYILLALGVAWDSRPALAAGAPRVSDAEALAVAAEHCAGCHSAQPSQPGFVAPPAGIVLESAADFHSYANRALVAVSSQYMPLGNLTGMETQERELLLNWLRQMSAGGAVSSND
ncbi:urate hydroxylase PuuD [Haliea sp. E17]|uniref:urate hydroxylase PuuD n=1 Tax=Haliea sp. E17 TaxID=3401576 RepID=UPI003AAEBC97